TLDNCSSDIALDKVHDESSRNESTAHASEIYHPASSTPSDAGPMPDNNSTKETQESESPPRFLPAPSFNFKDYHSADVPASVESPLMGFVNQAAGSSLPGFVNQA